MSETNTKQKKSRTVLVNGLAGLFGTCAGKSVMHPIDTIKAKLQVVTIPGLEGSTKVVAGEKGLMTRIIKETL